MIIDKVIQDIMFIESINKGEKLVFGNTGQINKIKNLSINKNYTKGKVFERKKVVESKIIKRQKELAEINLVIDYYNKTC